MAQKKSIKLQLENITLLVKKKSVKNDKILAGKLISFTDQPFLPILF